MSEHRKVYTVNGLAHLSAYTYRHAWWDEFKCGVFAYYSAEYVGYGWTDENGVGWPVMDEVQTAETATCLQCIAALP